MRCDHGSPTIRICVLFALAPLAGIVDAAHAAQPAPHKTQNVVLITYDGLRWQEVFGGCDETLLNREQGGGVRDLPGLKSRFWRGSPELRREALLPFFWKTIAVEGQVFGDPAHDCRVRVTNGLNFSYPGYNEILTGHADKAIDSNDKKPNHNVTVLEWLHARPSFAGRVAAFGSWDVFPYIINSQRSRIPVNAGWMPFDVGPDPVRLAALNDAVRDSMRVWGDVRDDGLTFLGSVEYVKAKRPRVLYISFGETDDWAHDGRYDQVLDSARRTDGFIERLWDLLQTLPEYAGKTSLVLTTDHGRGDTRVEWKSHGKDIPGSDRMWIAVMGPDTPATGCRSDLDVTQSQVAATVAELLGEDYRAVVPKAGAPLPGILHAERGAQNVE